MTDSPDLYPKPSLTVAPDVMSASLTLHPGGEPDEPSIDVCLGLLRAETIEAGPDVVTAIEDLLQQRSVDPVQSHTGVIVNGVASIPGEDGWVEFNAGFDPDDCCSDEPDLSAGPDDAAGEAATADFYNRRAFCFVLEGEVIGTVHEPTEGTPGRDVRGKALNTKAGKPVQIKTDETIERRDNGSLVARVGGVLVRNGTLLRVDQSLDVPGNVDFNTGNIRFSGDVVIEKGVRDCFIVEATGTVTVRGLVEAATIIAGADAVFESGMAAREKGVITVAGAVRARYLDNVDGTIGGALEVEKEIINCRLDIAGDIASPGATLAGGRLVAGAAIELNEIGSESGSMTEIVLGLSTVVESCEARAVAFTETISETRSPIEKEYDGLVRNLAKLNRDQQRRHRTLSKAIREIDEIEQKISDGVSSLHAAAGRCATVDVRARTTIHAGVRLIIGDTTVTITDDAPGPVRIWRSDDGELVIGDLAGASGRPIQEVASVTTRQVDEPTETQRAEAA